MKMRIVHITHDAEHRRELFGLIGELATSHAVHLALGAEVTSEPGRIWLVMLNETEEALGMASLHKLADGKRGKVQHLYAVDGPQAVRTLGRLLKAAETESRRQELTSIQTVDKATARRLYETHGWTGNGQRGQYTTYTLEIR